MYEAVHARPDGPSTVARQVRTAASHGYDGLVVRTREAAVPDGVDRYGVDIVDAAEVEAADPSEASGAVGHRRRDHTLLLLVGGTRALDRFAVEEPRVDVLVSPLDSGPDAFDHVLARAAADSGVRVSFDLGPVLRTTGQERVAAVRGLRRLHRVVTDAGAPHVVGATPGSHLELRAPRELAAVGDAVGLGAEFVREGLREWGRLAERNRALLAPDYVAPGVRVVDGLRCEGRPPDEGAYLRESLDEGGPESSPDDGARGEESSPDDGACGVESWDDAEDDP